jgi:hypothetical protein
MRMSGVQVHDAVLYFQQRHGPLPADCADALHACCGAVQRLQRQSQSVRPGAKQMALAKVVQQILEGATSSARVEARSGSDHHSAQLSRRHYQRSLMALRVEVGGRGGREVGQSLHRQTRCV